MNKLHELITVSGVLFFLAGCGGSGGGSGGGGDGGGGGTAFPTPTLPADAVKIDTMNAEPIATSALLFSQAILSISGKTEGPPSIPQVITLVTDQVIKRYRNLELKVAGKTEDLSDEFCDSGEAIDTYTESANSVTGDIKLTDCDIGGVVVNGTVPYEGSEDPATQDYNSRFGGTLTFDVAMERVTVVLDFVESGNDGTGDFSLTPSLSLDGLPDGGYLVTTVHPLMGIFDNLNSGELSVEGADNTKLCMPVTFINTITVLFDDGLGGGCVPLDPPLEFVI